MAKKPAEGIQRLEDSVIQAVSFKGRAMTFIFFFPDTNDQFMVTSQKICLSMRTKQAVRLLTSNGG